MRLTINLDEDLHRMAKALAIAENCSISAAVNKLLRRLNSASFEQTPNEGPNPSLHPKTGLPVVPCKMTITDEDVFLAEDESIRHEIT